MFWVLLVSGLLELQGAEFCYHFCQEQRGKSPNVWREKEFELGIKCLSLTVFFTLVE